MTEDFKGKVDGAGVKNDGLPVNLIPPSFIEGLAAVYAHGAKKYAPNNWMRGYSWSKTMAAMQRHMLAVARGEDIDPESGLLHVYHIAWHCATLSYYQTHDGYDQFDDRQFKPAKSVGGCVPAGVARIGG